MKEFRLVQTMAYYEDRKEPDEKSHQDIMNYPLFHGGSHHSMDSLFQIHITGELCRVKCQQK